MYDDVRYPVTNLNIQHDHIKVTSLTSAAREMLESRASYDLIHDYEDVDTDNRSERRLENPPNALSEQVILTNFIHSRLICVHL